MGGIMLAQSSSVRAWMLVKDMVFDKIQMWVGWVWRVGFSVGLLPAFCCEHFLAVHQHSSCVSLLDLHWWWCWQVCSLLIVGVADR